MSAELGGPVQVQSVQHFAEQLFLPALQVVPLAHPGRVGLALVAGDEAVAVKQSVAPPAHGIQLRRVPAFGLMPQEGVVRPPFSFHASDGRAWAVRSSGPVHLL